MRGNIPARFDDAKLNHIVDHFGWHAAGTAQIGKRQQPVIINQRTCHYLEVQVMRLRTVQGMRPEINFQIEVTRSCLTLSGQTNFLSFPNTLGNFNIQGPCPCRDMTIRREFRDLQADCAPRTNDRC